MDGRRGARRDDLWGDLWDDARRDVIGASTEADRTVM